MIPNMLSEKPSAYSPADKAEHHDPEVASLSQIFASCSRIQSFVQADGAVTK